MSLCFKDALPYGLALQHELERLGLKVFLCNVQHGDTDLTPAVLQILRQCKLAVVLGMELDGDGADPAYSTFEALQYILVENKPIFLVKMCHEFKEAQAFSRLTVDIICFPWQPQSLTERPPEDLVHRIAARTDALRTTNDGQPITLAPNIDGASLLAASFADQEDHPPLNSPAVQGLQGTTNSLSSWLAQQELDDLAPVLADLELDNLKDTIYAVKKGLVTEEQLVTRGIRRVRALRFMDLAKDHG